MNKPSLLTALLLLGCGAFAADVPQDEQDYARRNQEAERLKAVKKSIPAVELQPRNGLGNFFAKVKAGKPVTVVYFGGSITAHNGWRPQSFAWLQQRYPQSKMTMVNASMGGTGSIFGVFRADKDLVAKKPDLVFIEFAVNDGGDAQRRTKDVMRAIEGIIRKVKLADPQTDICIVYTIQEGNLKMLQAGKAQPAVAVHEDVAQYYGVPSIYFGPAIAKLVADGKVVPVGKVVDKAAGTDANGKIVFTDDKTHPVMPTGHALYADVVKRAIPELEKVPASPLPLPAPMFGESWEKAKTLPLAGNAVMTGKWTTLPGTPAQHQTLEPGATMTVRFNGSVVGLTTKVGPGSGKVLIKVDDRPEITENHFSVYGSNWRTSGGPLPELANGTHTVKWTLSGEKFDKGQILSSYYRKDNDRKYRENPALFADYGFNPLEIMLVGDIVKE